MQLPPKIASYLPMTETAYYILLSLDEPRHGYGILKFVEELTAGRIRLGSGTLYGTLGKMQRDGVLTAMEDRDRRTVYAPTAWGRELLRREMARIYRLYADTIQREERFT